jgi:hypothetical protein
MLYYHDAQVDIENKETRRFLSGLMIQPTGEFRNEYPRVGAFRISEDSGKAWFEKSGLEYQEVTLI